MIKNVKEQPNNFNNFWTKESLNHKQMLDFRTKLTKKLQKYNGKWGRR